jgi:hypothetical protein
MGGKGVLSGYRWIRCFLATMRWTLETELVGMKGNILPWQIKGRCIVHHYMYPCASKRHSVTRFMRIFFHASVDPLSPWILYFRLLKFCLYTVFRSFVPWKQLAVNC